ncbi:MAG: tetraacyldisaccharide 4'-kinase [Tidjanibacter sp.]|nr:tetraacyldisaccharide 4'-kinase [Tidjanibacter sp.]MBR4063864.1 tetraacyldisaccharide 4'-kinase [Tidjanibacter sp.]MBR7101966.1 tetraacyldisaccharide 4'-kinase [Tidjanibacter sp.]
MKFLRIIASYIYRAVISVRHWCYDVGLLRKHSVELPVICVGNITVGGTGKTPVVEYLIRHLSHYFRVAVLSRGYGRKTKGYLVVEPGMSFLRSGDEPKQIKRKFPSVPVVVCEDRVEGVRRIHEEFPDVELVIMDDGFQHRSITPKVNIVLVDYTRPVKEDHYLPWGNLRDKPSQFYRANIFLVTKTPDDLTPIERNITLKDIDILPYQSAYFTNIRSGEIRPLFPDVAIPARDGCKVVALAGVAHPKPFLATLKRHYEVLDTLVFADHYAYKVRDVARIAEELDRLGDDVVVVTTEKDAVKLTNRKRVPESLQRRLYVMPVFINFRDFDDDKFIQNIINDVKQN